MKNRVLEKFRAGTPAIGSFVALGSATAAELMAEAGMEWLAIEMEHSAVDWSCVQSMLMAVRASGAAGLVRLPNSDDVYIRRALDIGAAGIVVPSVRTAEEVRRIVSATRYPPAGTRGFGPLRAAGYGIHNEEYLRNANENLVVALIVETREAVENLEEIASVPGVDVLFLGPFDLSLALGLDPLRQPHREIEDVFARMAELAKEHGIAVGCGVGDREQMESRIAAGATMIAYGSDVSLLLEGAHAGVAAFRDVAKK